ncbi:MAG: hypothetical protein Tsb0021_15630 [Chlamydiales bacterium]
MLNLIFFNIVGTLMSIYSGLSGSCLADYAQSAIQQADEFREQGKTQEAIKLYNQAQIFFEKQRDYLGLMHALSGRLISWQHLYNHKQEEIYALYAKKEAEYMQKISKKQGFYDLDHLIHFFMGKSCILLKEYPKAESEFTEALKNYPRDDAEKGDWTAHLGEAIYKNGKKKEGIQTILNGISQINKHRSECDSFKYGVWTSGAYLRIAKILIQDQNIDQAKFYLSKGEEIIQRNPKLVIRKQQLESLKEQIENSYKS